jgi:hypothetical protein
MCFRFRIASRTTRTVLSYRPYDPQNPRTRKTRKPERHCADLACMKGNDQRTSCAYVIERLRARYVCGSSCECVGASPLRVRVLTTWYVPMPVPEPIGKIPAALPNTCSCSACLELLTVVDDWTWPCLSTELTIDAVRERTPLGAPPAFSRTPSAGGS